MEMEGGHNFYTQGSNGWTTLWNEELQEEDIWGVLKERKEYNSRIGSSRDSYNSTGFSSKRLPAAPAVMIPRASNPSLETKAIQHSAPVNIPNWSKIYGNHSMKSSKNDSWLDEDYNGGGRRSNWETQDEDDQDYDTDNMVPPHEWIAKKLARSQISSFSVCEGAGRTLKGRDLSRVRNVVLTKTGFLE